MKRILRLQVLRRHCLRLAICTVEGESTGSTSEVIVPTLSFVLLVQSVDKDWSVSENWRKSSEDSQHSKNRFVFGQEWNEISLLILVEVEASNEA